MQKYGGWGGDDSVSILQNLKLYKFDKEKKIFVSDLAKNLNPGTLKRFLTKKFFENFFGPSENFFFRAGKIESAIFHIFGVGGRNSEMLQKKLFCPE